MDDNTIYNRLARDSFNSVYTLYYRKSFLFAKSYVHDDYAAEDIASESLIKLWEKMKNEIVEEKMILPLLLTILKNKALDYLKHEEVKRMALGDLTDWHQQELSTRISTLQECNPNEIFSDEVVNIVRQTLQTFSDQTRQIFVLSRMENKSNAEIAQELNISVKGVEYHITKALKALRISLKDYLPLFYFFFCY